MVASTAGQTNVGSQSSASRRINEIHTRTTQREREIAELVPKLASRSYHLEEGNSWCEDWLQYQKNTHPSKLLLEVWLCPTLFLKFEVGLTLLEITQYSAYAFITPFIQ